MNKLTKRILSLVMCLLMMLSSFSTSVLLEVGTVIAQAAESLTASKAGDINGDGFVNNKDLTRLMRFISGEDVDVAPVTIDVNGDDTVNNKDLTRLMRYLSGDDVEIKINGCTHEKKKIKAVAATCTKDGNIEYWYCSECDKYFGDGEGKREIAKEETITEKLGHNEDIRIPGYPATADKEGLTDGAKCSRCGEISKEQEIIQINGYEIIYNIAGNDTYLAKLLQEGKIHNPNPSSYSSDNEFKLKKNIVVDGYTFEGWYDAPGSNGKIVDSIPAGTTGKIELFAKWTKVVYQVIFDSPDVPWDSVTYTVDTGVTLTKPSWFGYTFVGWSNDDGFIVNSIKPGTIGHIRLHANWTSNRNKATSYRKYDKPIIIEDSKNSQFLFVYDIGKIENIPVSEIVSFIGTEGVNIKTEYTVSTAITDENIKGVVNAVSNATTKSSGWTLSNEWNTLYSEGSEDKTKQVKTEERTDSEGKVVGGNYFISNSSGGSSFSSTESGGSNSTSAKITTENSFGINASYDKSTEKYCDAKLSVENKTEFGVDAKVPVKFATIGADFKNTTTVGTEITSGRKDNTSYHVDGNVSSYVGTDESVDSNSYYNTVSNSSSNWNSTSGYNKSYETSVDTSITKAIADEISKTTSYNVSESLGGASTDTYVMGEEERKQDEYSHTVKYSKGTTDSKTIAFETKASATGNYRVVQAATVHVYGVVGYDVATCSYYTYTFNVLDDDLKMYLDYSKDSSSFDDCENGLVTFEVPYEVNEYIAGVTGETKGLKYDENNTVSGFVVEDGEEFDGTVVVPQYRSKYHEDKYTYSAIKVTKISEKAFRNNKDIETIILPLYVTEIPDNAFEGCTNLKRVIAYGVTKIGKNAFKGCTSLEHFSIDNHIIKLGDNAFSGVVNGISVMAANASIAEAAVKSGADSITLNISKISDKIDNHVIKVPEGTKEFTLIGDGREYNNLKIVSDAETTFISNVAFANNKDTPITISSENVKFGRVKVIDAPGFAAIFTGENVDLKLYDDNKLGSTGDNAILSKNISLSELNSTYAGKFTVTGNYLINGEMNDENKLFRFVSGRLMKIDNDEFDNYLKSITVSFDANGGTLAADQTKKVVYYGQKYSALPTPTRENYTFAGWYTEKNGGTQVTADSAVSALVNQTLYAKWTPNKFVLTYDANGGSVSPTNKTLTFGDTYGSLPTPKRDYYKFDGWYTAASGGTKITTSSVINEAKDLTIYAHWTKNPVTSWVEDFEAPDDAEIIDTKYTYDLTEYKSSSNSSMSGWTKYDTKRTSWDATQGPVYSDPSNNSRNVWSERYETSRTRHYKYYHRHVNSKTWGSDSSASSGARHTIDLTYALTDTWQGTYTWHKSYKCPQCGATNMWLPDGEYDDVKYGTRWYYQDPVYTYYYKRVVEKESTSDPSSLDNVSNVQKWVKYIAK